MCFRMPMTPPSGRRLLQMKWYFPFLPQCREGEELTILSRKEEGAVYVAAVHTDG